MQRGQRLSGVRLDFDDRRKWEGNKKTFLLLRTDQLLCAAHTNRIALPGSEYEKKKNPPQKRDLLVLGMFLKNQTTTAPGCVGGCV